VGLSEALRQLCRGFAERSGIAFDCRIEDTDPLEPAVAQTIYRTAEAALANVEQHANAGNITVTLTRQDAVLRLVVCDDGAGFDPAQVAADRYGLAGMRERAAAVGATLTVHSAPGRGTEIALDTGI
jgi:signal transduction histidine kinase